MHLRSAIVYKSLTLLYTSLLVQLEMIRVEGEIEIVASGLLVISPPGKCWLSRLLATSIMHEYMQFYSRIITSGFFFQL